MLKYFIIITMIIIAILSFIYFIKLPKHQVRYIPHNNYTDTFFDTYTHQVKLCPNECPVFNVEKQKCVKGTVTTNICENFGIGYVAHYYRCNNFYICPGNINLKCSENFCFSNILARCVEQETNQCACFPASICTDCCADEQDGEF
ncbi:ac150-like protein [Alphabaculovirus altersperidaniae]|uniref:Ac150-like protein n=1 Tax=Spodoptera eridania nucleopolyhedrovirus TaxID=2315721 RepID=A0ABX6TQQ1_9ABAC|nr:ac150-like protein [Spodoptera eridania nucleopolyhedrovirus]QNV47810.1 ac150-like protein [Spodoptera eridania nucleopolyhedrovirus]